MLARTGFVEHGRVEFIAEVEEGEEDGGFWDGIVGTACNSK